MAEIDLCLNDIPMRNAKWAVIAFLKECINKHTLKEWIKGVGGKENPQTLP